MNPETDWASAIAILAAGLVLGLLFVVFFNKRRTAKTLLGGESDLALKDLQARRDALIQQLRDPAISADERARLERDTADVLKQLDAYQPARPAAASSTAAGSAPAVVEESATAMNPAIKGFLWGAGSFAALAGLAYFVMQSASPRADGGSVTGNTPPMAQQQAQPQTDPMILQLEAGVQKDPNNLQLRNDLAQAYLERDNLMGVFEQTKFVLEKEPENSRALTFQGLVRMAMGEQQQAVQMLQHATKSDPKNLDSWVALAWVYAQSDRMDDAKKMIAEAAKQSPGDKARLDQVFAQMQQQAAEAKSQPAQTAQSGELPPGHPPVDGAPTPAPAIPAQAAAAVTPPAAGGAKSIRLTLDLDGAAKSKTGVLYVIARPLAGGPPVAVKRMPSPAFPLTFDFGSADSMMGQPLPDRFRLEARLDSDGDAATKPATDPSAMQPEVAPGAVVKLALK